MNNAISIYPYHDGSVSVKIGNKYRIFEVERFTKKRYATIIGIDYNSLYKAIYKIIKEEYGVTTFNLCLYNTELPQVQIEYLKDLWQIVEFRNCGHHLAHAMGTFYQSPFNESYIISFDGGGQTGDIVDYFEVYYANRETGQVIHCASIPIDLGTPYGVTAIPIKEINKDGQQPFDKFLSYAGKLMGLSAYGKLLDKFYIPLMNFYKNKSGNTDLKYEELKQMKDTMQLTSMHINLKPNSLNGDMAYHLAYNSQIAFEKVFFEYMHNFLSKSKIPICLTGGCALNVLLNQKIKDTYNLPMFIAPNPNDCGVSFGMIMSEFPTKEIVDITYAGWPILDIEELPNYVKEYNAQPVTHTDIIDLVEQGNIVGLMSGNSECGPRALGNRSIICDPSIPDMKDKLNEKVKFREWFRPFAPVVHADIASNYFEFEGESPYMSFAPKIKEYYKDAFPAITHVDGTARLQTVTLEQHQDLYELLRTYRGRYGKDILLNTSFNIKGKPILTRISDAIEVLETTEIDYVVIEGFLFKRK